MTRLARSFAFRALLTAAILAYLASRIPMGEAAAALLRLDLRYAALVVLLLAADRLVMIGRWLLLLRASRAPVSAGLAMRIYLVSSFVGSFLPAGVGADGVRAYSLGRQTAEHSEAVASVAVDRLLGLSSLVLLGLTGAVVWIRRPEASPILPAVIAAALLALGALTLLWADRVLRAAPAAWRGSSAGTVAVRLGDAIGRYRGRRTALALVLALSLLVQVLRIAQAWLLGDGLGLAVPFAYYLLFMPVGLLMLLLPVSVSGFGLPQGVIVWLLRPVGVPEAEAFALSTLIVLTGLAGNLPGALLYLAGRRRTSPTPLPS